ncbi:MAG TPA: hypothetical protein VFM77_03540 [Terriglobales bacterium]|nr:hypothetical protein [Terriglobales bacterium]
MLFEVATVLILRAHYTMDVFTGGATALCAAQLADYVSRKIAKDSSTDGRLS